MSKLKLYAQDAGLSLSEKQEQQFDIYCRELLEWNEKINLTAIKEPEGVEIRHFFDSLTLFCALDIKPNSKMIDVGTGAGFPGVAAKIYRPDINLTLLDSTKKKLTVIEDILAKLGLNAEIVHSRAEELGHNSGYRENFDVVTARAVANLRELSEFCIPFVKKGGVFAAMKGPDAGEELKEAQNAISILGGTVREVKNLTLPDGSERNIILIEKTSGTPQKYPRTGTKIAKSPL